MVYSALVSLASTFHNTNSELEPTCFDKSSSQFSMKEVIHDALHTLLDASILPSSCGLTTRELRRHNLESEDIVISVEIYLTKGEFRCRPKE